MLAVKIDVSGISHLAAALADLSRAQRERIVPRVINDIGDAAYTQVVRAIAAESSMPQNRVRKVLQKKKAYLERPQYEIRARDEYTSLKDFRPVQTKAGLRVKVWGKIRTYRGKNVAPFIGPGGHVYKRISRHRLPIEKLWGPAVPKELIRGYAYEAAQKIAAEKLGPRLAYQMDREIGRVKAKYKV